MFIEPTDPSLGGFIIWLFLNLLILIWFVFKWALAIGSCWFILYAFIWTPGSGWVDEFFKAGRKSANEAVIQYYKEWFVVLPKRFFGWVNESWESLKSKWDS